LTNKMGKNIQIDTRRLISLFVDLSIFHRLVIKNCSNCSKNK
jgi:hypothetical protein